MKLEAPAKRKIRSNRLQRNQMRSGLVFILPSFILCAVFMVYPMIEVVRYSFTNWDGLAKTYEYVGLDN